MYETPCFPLICPDPTFISLCRFTRPCATKVFEHEKGFEPRSSHKQLCNVEGAYRGLSTVSPYYSVYESIHFDDGIPIAQG